MTKENEEENSTPSPEELKEEEEALKDSKEEEVRSSIIEKYGLDEDDQSDLVDQLMQDQLEQRKAFGKVVGQKIKYREAATNAASSKEEPKEKEQPNKDKETPDVDTLVNEKFEERDLVSLELPEDIKSEVQKLAKAQGISVLQASKDPYIVFKKEQYEQEAKMDKATPSRTRKGTTVKFDVNEPPKPDMSTEEGQKEWSEYKEFLSSQ